MRKVITSNINICTGKASPVLSEKAAIKFLEREKVVSSRVHAKIRAIRENQK